MFDNPDLRIGHGPQKRAKQFHDLYEICDRMAPKVELCYDRSSRTAMSNLLFFVLVSDISCGFSLDDGTVHIEASATRLRPF